MSGSIVRTENGKGLKICSMLSTIMLVMEISSDSRQTHRRDGPSDKGFHNDDSTVFKNVRCAEDEIDNEISWELASWKLALQSLQRSFDSFPWEPVRNRTSNEDLIEGANENDGPDKAFDAKRRRMRGPT
jgi:hypothetical protein